MNRQNPKELSYFYHPSNILEWMNEDPPEEELMFDERGKKSIPYHIMKSYLDHLCPENWDIKNFHFMSFFTNDRRHWISGNIDLVISYAYELPDGSGVRKVDRTLAGAATFCAEEYAPNTHWAATVKSLAVCNAAQPIGRRFGWLLNPLEDEKPDDVFSGPIPSKQKPMIHNGKASILMPPPPDIKEKYDKAVREGNITQMRNLEKIYKFTANA